MTISNESMNLKDPKESDDPQLFDDTSSCYLIIPRYDLQLFDDPQLFDDKLEVWTLIIEKSTVIPPSLMVLFNFKERGNCLNLYGRFLLSTLVGFPVSHRQAPLELEY